METFEDFLAWYRGLSTEDAINFSLAFKYNSEVSVLTTLKDFVEFANGWRD